MPRFSICAYLLLGLGSSLATNLAALSRHEVLTVLRLRLRLPASSPATVRRHSPECHGTKCRLYCACACPRPDQVLLLSFTGPPGQPPTDGPTVSQHQVLTLLHWRVPSVCLLSCHSPGSGAGSPQCLSAQCRRCCACACPQSGSSAASLQPTRPQGW